jgi:signal transduction histidine kinase
MPPDFEYRNISDQFLWRSGNNLEQSSWHHDTEQSRQDKNHRDVDVARLREFTRFVINELSDPLTAISSYTEMCRDVLSQRKVGRQVSPQQSTGSSRSLEELLELIAFNSSRLRSLLTSFQRPLNEASGSWTIVHVDEVISAALAGLTKTLHDQGISVEIQRSPPRAPILADPVQLGQLVSRILRHSIENVTRGEHSEKTRLLTISFRKDTDLHGGANGIDVRFIDSGPEYPENITRPFLDHETNEVKLEMAALRTIMERHGGTLDIEHTSAEKTGVRIRFPICKVAPAKLAELQKRV